MLSRIGLVVKIRTTAKSTRLLKGLLYDVKKILIRSAVPIFILFIMFTLSLIVRMDTFRFATVGQYAYSEEYDRHLNTDVFIHVIYVMKIYQSIPFSDHLFGGYIGTSDEYLQSARNDSLTVYSSFSPTLFVIPYAVFSAINADFTYRNLQYFGLAIHLLSVILIFILLRVLLPRTKIATFVSLLGTSVYIFSTSTLHNHMNVYWAHQLLQPVLLVVLITFAARNGHINKVQAFISSLLLSLVAWTGVIISGALIIYYLYEHYYSRRTGNIKIALSLIAGLILGILLLAAHVLFLTETSLVEYIQKVSERVEARSINPAYEISFIELLTKYIKGLIFDYGAYIISLIGLAVVYCFRKEKVKLRKIHIAVVLICSLALAESILLLEHDTVYTFGRLKFALPILLLMALLAHGLLANTRKFKTTLAFVSISFLLPALIHTYIYHDSFGKNLHKQDSICITYPC